MDTNHVDEAGSTEDAKRPSAYFKKLTHGLGLPDYYIEFHSVPGGFLSPEHAPLHDLLSETVFT